MGRKPKQKEAKAPKVDQQTLIKRVIGVGRIMGMNLTPNLVQLANDDQGIILIRKITALCFENNPTVDDVDKFVESLKESPQDQPEVAAEAEVQAEEVTPTLEKP